MRKIVSFMKVVSLLLFIFSLPFRGQSQTASGTIQDVDKRTPLAGVTIKVVGTNIATQTNDNGVFTIKVAQGQTLDITYIGYEPQKILMKKSISLDIMLKSLPTQLGDVVVTAMGIKKERKALGYSVSDLNAQELMKNKNTNVINSLAGKVPGVNITQFSGSAGSGASITIRGGNSTSDSRQNQPLFVIDGIIYDNSTTVTGNTVVELSYIIPSITNNG